MNNYSVHVPKYFPLFNTNYVFIQDKVTMFTRSVILRRTLGGFRLLPSEAVAITTFSNSVRHCRSLHTSGECASYNIIKFECVRINEDTCRCAWKSNLLRVHLTSLKDNKKKKLIPVCRCTKFQGINVHVAASIQMHAIYTMGKHPCTLK